MSKREKQKHCFHVSDVLDVIACLLGNFDVGEEKRVQEGKKKALSDNQDNVVDVVIVVDVVDVVDVAICLLCILSERKNVSRRERTRHQ